MDNLRLAIANPRHEMISKECIWIVSNMMCCTTDYVSRCFSQGLIRDSFDLFNREKDPRMRNEVAYII